MSPTIQHGDPFQFVAASYLVEIRHERARNLYELLLHLRGVPESSVFFHTFQSMEAHHYTSFANDFAQWVHSECNDVRLAERLGAVDMTSFPTVAEVRDALCALIEEHVEQDPYAGARPATEAFHFCTMETVTAPLDRVAHNVAELAAGIRAISHQTLHHHFISSRLRPRLLVNDFSIWLQQSLGLTELGDQINRIDFFTNTLEGVRQEILRDLAPYEGR
jgi:hypothetical protein